MAPTSSTLDPLHLTAHHLQSLLTSGEVTSVELVQLYQSHIRKYDGHLHAMISLTPEHIALEHAARLDAERAEKENGKGLRSRLHGIPIVIKDNIATGPELGMKTTAGNLALAQSETKGHARVVELLLDAGLIIIGKASLSELSNFKGNKMPGGWNAVRGQTQSAFMRDGLAPGDEMYGHSCTSGSSSGSAVAASAGYAPFTLGSETSGSLISPGGRAGIYTLRTHGRVSGAGVVPISPTLDMVGPMTTCVEDLVDLYDVILGTGGSGLRECLETASWGELNVATLDPEKWLEFPEGCPVREEVKPQMAREINEAYARVKSLARSFQANVELPPREHYHINNESGTWALMKLEFRLAFNTYLSTLLSSPIHSLSDLITFNTTHASREMPPGFGDQSALESSQAQTTSPEAISSAISFLRRKADDEALGVILQTADVILAPADSVLCDYAAAAELPIAAMPLGRIEYNGRPFGVVVLAREERMVVKAMKAWEGMMEGVEGWKRPVPDLEVLPKKEVWDGVAVP